MSCDAHKLAVTRRFLDWADVDLIRELTAMLPPDRNVVVVDLGAGSGTTAGAVWAERAERIRITTYDIDPTNLHWSGVFMANIGAAEAWQGHLKDSTEAAAEWGDESIDLLMLDTSHTYEQTVAELDAWLPKVRRDGWVWCHDYRGDYPGVTNAIDELCHTGHLETWKVEGLGWSGNRPRMTAPAAA